MNFWKRQLPSIIVFVVGMTMVIRYYIPHPASSVLYEETIRWVRIVTNFALLLGVGNLAANHFRKIQRKQPGYGYSAVVFAAFLAMVVLGLGYGIDAPQDIHRPIEIQAATMQSGGTLVSEVKIDPGFAVSLEVPLGSAAPQGIFQGKVGDDPPVALELGKEVRFKNKGVLTLLIPQGAGKDTTALSIRLRQSISPGYWLFQNVKVSMEATMYSLLAFFVSSAAFRAFRARSFDAALMLLAAVVMMIGRTSFGETISSWFSQKWLFFPEATKWLLDVPVTAAKRALFLGLTLSFVATSIRILFGIERSYLGRSD